MAPEQIEGMPTHRSDQYSLAMVAYRMFAERFPYTSRNGPEGLWKLHSTIDPYPLWCSCDIPLQIELVIMKALSRNPHDRYGSIRKFLQALEDAERDIVAEAAKKAEREAIHAQVTEIMEAYGAPERMADYETAILNAVRPELPIYRRPTARLDQALQPSSGTNLFPIALLIGIVFVFIALGLGIVSVLSTAAVITLVAVQIVTIAVMVGLTWKRSIYIKQ